MVGSDGRVALAGARRGVTGDESRACMMPRELVNITLGQACGLLIAAGLRR